MIAAETIVSNKNFMLKFSKKRIEVTPSTGSCEQGQRVSFVDEQNHSSFVNASNQSEMKKALNSVSCPSGGGKKLDPEYLKAKSSMPGSNKRGPLQLIECQREKRQKMDRSVTSQCSTILKKLMTHPAGWVFNKPVDPVGLNIPDYFSIIKNPMDLGTIKSKLVKNMYFGTEEFEADIRLTFSNAMLYNPPDNSVHKMAVELNNIFETRWKASEEKRNRESSTVGQGKLSSGRVKETNDTRQNVDKGPPSHNNLLLKRSMTSVEKVPRSSDGRDVELAKTARNCTRKSSGKDFQKGVDSGNRHACGSVNAKASLSPIARKCGRCGNSTCQCILPCDSTHASSSDLSSERSVGRDHRVCGVDASIQDCQAKSMSVSQMSKTGPDSDGAVSAFDDENACLTSQPTLSATDATSQEGCPDFDVHLSPKKALRVAMLKSRYAETILKAQEKTLLDNGNKADPLKMQQEKEKLERRQREERAKIEAQIRVAEAASRGKAAFSLIFVVLLLISYSIFMGTVDFRSYFFPLIQSPAGARSLSATTNPPLRVYMYDLPRRYNVGMMNRRNPDQTPVTGRTWPPWPRNWGLKRQHSVEYWMMGSLLYETDGGAEEREAVRVFDPEMADTFFVPFFSSLSFNTHGHTMTDPETLIDRQLQIDLLKLLRQSKYWQRSGGRDHVIPMTHPNAFRFLREQVNASIQIVVDFGRHPRIMSNLSKDVVSPYVHVVDSFTDDDTPDPYESRTTLLFFRGRTFRKDEGIVRVKLAKILAGYDDVHYERSVATSENIRASSRGMRSSKFCLHPAGDTPSSCRLFDAIVSHCVPVIVSDQIELPFEDEIDYTQFSLFFSFKEALEPGYMVNQLRKFPKERWIDMWKRLKNISHHYEFQYPPKKEDAVNMLWRQVKHKLPEVKLAVHRSRRLKVPDWWRRRR